MSVDAEFVLYVNKCYNDMTQYDVGSSQCLKIIETFKDRILIQDIDSILENGIELPSWLDGTPIVVDTKDSTAHKGERAVSLLLDVMNRIATEKKTEDTEPTLDDQFTNNEDKEVEDIIEQRANTKPNEDALAEVIRQREMTDKKQSKPKSNAMPKPLPADS